APEDQSGYRLALIEAFRARGIFPDRVHTISVDSLRWSGSDFTPKQQNTFNRLAEILKRNVSAIVETSDRKSIYDHSVRAQMLLHQQLLGKVKFYGDSEWEHFLNRLGLTSLPVSQLFGKASSKV